MIVALLLTTASLGNQPLREVAARLDNDPIYLAEVEQELRRTLGNQQPPESEKPALLRATLHQLIDRRLILRYLAKSGLAASKADIDLAVTQFENDLKTQNLTLAGHLAAVGLTTDDMRRSLAWKLSWQKYLERQLTEANLEKYFQRYRRDFDGTRLRVAQILWKLAPEADAAAQSAAKEQALAVKRAIVAGQFTFEAAARKHSQAPSNQTGGDIGWIERHKPMPEDFSRIAFALQAGEISEPFPSPFGLHLVTILEEQPGTKTWREVESELRPAVTLYLFRWLADQERPKAKIELLLP